MSLLFEETSQKMYPTLNGDCELQSKNLNPSFITFLERIKKSTYEYWWLCEVVIIR